MKTDDLVRSMKAQMQPDDEVVSALLAKINQQAQSPVTANDQVLPFAAAKKSMPHTASTGAARKAKRALWRYGTLAAACLLVLMATVLLISGDGNPSIGAKHLLQQITGPDSTISQPVPPANDPIILPPGRSEEEDLDGSGTAQSKDSVEANSDGNPAVSAQQPVNQKQQLTQPVKNQKTEVSDSTPSDTAKPEETDNKVTPGAPGETDLKWTDEIMKSSAVASVSIFDEDYVVNSTTDKSEVSAPIDTVTVKLPQTSSTNSAKLQGTVYSLKNVSSSAMVALEVEGFSETLVYANANYSPSTLGEFIDDLGLNNKMTFAKTVYCTGTKQGAIKKDIAISVWKHLLSDGSAGRADSGAYKNGKVKVTFVSNNNSTDSQIRFGVSSNGYLYVSVLGNDFTFHIGMNNARNFIEQITGETLGAELAE